ncbi:MAG: ATP-dependent DNA helicase [Spirochaetia bacterium]
MKTLPSDAHRADALSMGISLEDIKAVENLVDFLKTNHTNLEFPEFVFWMILHLFQRLHHGCLFCDLDNIHIEASLWIAPDHPKATKILYQLNQAKTELGYTTLCAANLKNSSCMPLLLIHGRFLYLRSSYLLEDKFWHILQESPLFQNGQPFLNISENDMPTHCAKLKILTHEIEGPLLQAIKTIHEKNLLILTGGPGTGKTWTLGVLLYSLVIESRKTHPNRPLVIVLAAPTGRAQSRMIESLWDTYQDLLTTDTLLEIPSQGQTLHKLLHTHPHSLDNDSPIPIFADVVAIDESSMIDLQLFQRLIASIPPHCKLILLGDPNQLPSVELGAVFSDMLSTYSCDPQHFLAPYTVTLKKIWRSQNAAISNLATAALEGNATLFYQQEIPLSEETTFYREKDRTVQFSSLQNIAPKRLLAWIKGLYKIKKDPISFQFLQRPGPHMHQEEQQRLEDLFHLFESTCILSARRDRHPLSVDEINIALQREQSHQRFFEGMPIIVQQNLEEHHLSNGERGLVILVKNQLFCCFRGKNVLDWKLIPLSLLQNYLQPSYAMTIHKSQGSEFEHVCIILPDHCEVLMNRSLLFTAITRAKKYVTLFANPDVLDQSLISQNIATSCLGYRCIQQFPVKKPRRMGQQELFE